MLLNMERVCKTYGDRTLLDHVTFYMKQGDRVGVVGVNGCGPYSGPPGRFPPFRSPPR